MMRWRNCRREPAWCRFTADLFTGGRHLSGSVWRRRGALREAAERTNTTDRTDRTEGGGPAQCAAVISFREVRDTGTFTFSTSAAITLYSGHMVSPSHSWLVTLFTMASGKW